MVREIVLRPPEEGRVALVDDEDFERVSQLVWYFHPRGYAHRVHPSVFMHRFILGLSRGDPHVDHANQDGLDNRRSNLRFADHSQNMANRGVPRGAKSSRFKGVCWDTTRGKWRAQIQPQGRSVTLGYFLTEEEAAVAYNQAAPGFFGEFAFLNEVK